MLYKTLLVIICVIVLFISPASGISWYHIADGEFSRHSIDRDSIIHMSTNKIRLRKQIKSRIPSRLIDRLIEFVEYDCTERNYVVIQKLLYFSNGTLKTSNNEERKDVIPDSPGEKVYRFVCNLE